MVLLCVAYCTIIHSTGEKYKIFLIGVVKNSCLVAFSGDCSGCGHVGEGQAEGISSLHFLILPECGAFCRAGMDLHRSN